MGQQNLPCASADAVARTFERLGWTREPSRKRKNPHIILTKPGHRATLSIPSHKGKDVKRGLLAGLIKDAGETEASFCAAFK